MTVGNGVATPHFVQNLSGKNDKKIGIHDYTSFPDFWTLKTRANASVRKGYPLYISF